MLFFIESKKMEIVITGGGGYIGSVLVKKLIETYNRVIVIDNRMHGNRIVSGSDYYSYTIGAGVCDLINVIRHCDIVVHLAGDVRIVGTEKDPLSAFFNNTVATEEIVSCCVDFKKPLLYASTGGVYGNLECPEDGFREDGCVAPGNVYSESKYFGERIVVSSKAYGLKYGVFRFFNVIGGYKGYYEKFEDSEHILPRLISSAINCTEFSVYGSDWGTGDGTAVRDYVDVSDIADGIIAGISKVQEQSFLVNLGNGKGITVLEMIRAVSSALNKNVKCEYVDRRQGDVPILMCNNTRSKKILGWSPKISIEESIRNLIGMMK